jgi:hypothetical protein
LLKVVNLSENFKASRPHKEIMAQGGKSRNLGNIRRYTFKGGS